MSKTIDFQIFNWFKTVEFVFFVMTSLPGITNQYQCTYVLVITTISLSLQLSKGFLQKTGEKFFLCFVLSVTIFVTTYSSRQDWSILIDNISIMLVTQYRVI